MTDWTKIETEYTQGPRPLRAIAADHGITEGAIRGMAKRRRWVRTHPDVRAPVRNIVRNGYALTERQHMVIEEAQIDGSLTRAAERVGYADPIAAAAELKRSDPAQAAALERIEAVAARCGLTAELVMRSIVRELQFDPANVFNPDGSMKPIHEIDPDTRMALQSVETAQVGSLDAPTQVRKVKWAAANQAREQAMKHLGLFLIDNSQRTDPLAALIQAIQGRATIAGPVKITEQVIDDHDYTTDD